MKKKATKDKKFLAEIRKLRCLACGEGPSRAHHIKTVGSGGGDDAWNLLPLCDSDHTMGPNAWHRGIPNFLAAYPWVMDHMSKLGWYWSPQGKLRNEHYDTLK